MPYYNGMDQFIALADPTRRSIIESLVGGERSFGEIAGEHSMSKPAVSQHLRVLRETGWVAVRRDAQRRIYRLSDTGLDEVSSWLDKIRSYWTPRLDALQAELEKAR